MVHGMMHELLACMHPMDACMLAAQGQQGNGAKAAAVLWAKSFTHSTTAISHSLFNVIPFKLANDASVLTPQKCLNPSDP